MSVCALATHIPPHPTHCPRPPRTCVAPSGGALLLAHRRLSRPAAGAGAAGGAGAAPRPSRARDARRAPNDGRADRAATRPRRAAALLRDARVGRMGGAPRDDASPPPHSLSWPSPSLQSPSKRRARRLARCDASPKRVVGRVRVSGSCASADSRPPSSPVERASACPALPPHPPRRRNLVGGSSSASAQVPLRWRRDVRAPHRRARDRRRRRWRRRKLGGRWLVRRLVRSLVKLLARAAVRRSRWGALFMYTTPSLQPAPRWS